MTKRQQIVHTLSRHFTRGDIQGATDELLSLLDVVKSLPNADDITEAAYKFVGVPDDRKPTEEEKKRLISFIHGATWYYQKVK